MKQKAEAPVPVHTIGYQLRQPEELIAVLLDAGVAVLVDVRETAWSNRREYSRGRLASALEAAGLQYEHARYAGNPKELRRTATTHAECLRAYSAYLDGAPDVLDRLEELVSTHHENGRRVAFFCYERHPGDCHRGILVQRLQDRATFPVAVTHLATDGAPRFS